MGVQIYAATQQMRPRSETSQCWRVHIVSLIPKHLRNKAPTPSSRKRSVYQDEGRHSFIMKKSFRFNLMSHWRLTFGVLRFEN